ncbi:MAG: O-antigen ligase family protein [Candidatus Omnitrophota bacterium]
MCSEKGVLKQFDFWLLMVILFLMPIAGTFTLAGKPVQISDVLFLIYFLVWFSKKIIRKDIQVNAKFYIFCGMLVIFCLSTFFSPFKAKSVVGLAIKIYLLTLAYVISEEINSVSRFKAAINTILLSGTYVIFLSFWGMLSFVIKSPSIFLCPSDILDLPLRFLPRLQSTFSSSSFLSSFLSIVIVILLGNILFEGLPFKRLFNHAIYIILAAIVFIFTFSRDLIGLGWGLIFLLRTWDMDKKRLSLIIAHFKWVMVLITVFLLVCSIWYIFPIKIYKTPSTITLPSDEVQYELKAGDIVSRMGWISERFISFNSRMHNRFMELKDAGKTFINNPVFGIGVGVLPSQGYFPQSYSRSSHNTYLQVLSQTGILGFAIFLIFIIAGLFRVLLWQGQNPQSYSIRVIFQVILLVLLINMFFTDLDNFRYFWIISGLILSLNNPNIKDA